MVTVILSILGEQASNGAGGVAEPAKKELPLALRRRLMQRGIIRKEEHAASAPAPAQQAVAGSSGVYHVSLLMFNYLLALVLLPLPDKDEYFFLWRAAVEI